MDLKIIEMQNKNTAYLDKDNELTIKGTFNFEGSILEFKKIIDNVIEEYGDDTECKLVVTGRFPHNWSSKIIITNKN